MGLPGEEPTAAAAILVSICDVTWEAWLKEESPANADKLMYMARHPENHNMQGHPTFMGCPFHRRTELPFQDVNCIIS